MVVARVAFFQKKVFGLRLRTWLLFFVLTPFVLWGLLNLIFWTGWGTGFLEKRVEARVGLACEIESVSWAPWAGVNVGNVGIHPSGETSSESPLFEIDRLHLDPSWLSFTKGEIRWERLEVGAVKGRVSIEQLKEILAKYHENHPVKVISNPVKPVAPLEIKTEDGVVATPKKSKPSPDQEAVPPVVVPQRKQDSGKKSEAVPVDDFRGIIILEDMDLELYSEEHSEFSIRLDDVAGEIPIWGESREGELRVGEVALGSRLSEKSLNFPVTWGERALRLEKAGMKIFGVDLNVKGVIRLSAGLPAGLQIDLPDQQMDLSPIYMSQNSPVELAHLSSRNTLRGQLLNPRSFNGQSLTKFKGLVLHDPKDGGDVRFESGLAAFQLSASGIVAKDLRVIGEEDSILMNGFVTTGGQAAATVRIVSSPERASSHEKRIRNSSQALELSFLPLVTPDREYRDVRIEARSGTLMMDLGIDEQWVPLVPSVRAILGKSSQLKAPRLP